MLIHVLLVAALSFAVIQIVLLAVNLAGVPRLSRIGDGKGSRAAGERAFPKVTVVIPARNEERDVAAAVRSHLEQDYPRGSLEVVAVDDRSGDATGSILRDLASQDARLTVLAGAAPPPGWLGKPHALSQGAARAQGELLLFADADVRYDPRTLSEAVAFLEQRGADFVALFPRLEGRGFWENVLMPYLPTVFYFGLGFLANAPRAREVAAGGGAGNLIRRSTYEAIGGHEALRDSVVDDIHLALNSKRGGFSTLVVRAEDRVRVRMYRGFREVCNGFTKNVAYVVADASGAVLLILLLVTLALAVLPVGVIAASLAGAAISSGDLRLAAGALLVTAISRGALARTIGEPLWPSLFHPVLAAVWTGIIGRSFFHRFVRRRLLWRGREYDARSARF